MKKIDIIKILRDGGATLDINGQPVHYSRGYQVSRRDCFIITIGNINGITRAVNGLLKYCEAGDFVGLWVDGDRVYIDISERVDRLSDAMRIGIARGQKSIFDWCLDRCIALEV